MMPYESSKIKHADKLDDLLFGMNSKKPEIDEC
jgi:hypothetical protein